MSNRILGFLLLIVIGILGFFYWVYFYVPSLEKQNDENIDYVGTGEIINLIPIEENLPVDLGEVDETTNSGESLVSGDIVSSENKMNSLRMDLESYKIIEIGSNKFNFVESDNTLTLYLNGKIVSVFPLVPENYLDIKKVYSTNDEYLINIDGSNYIYNGLIDKLILVDLNVGVNYLKKDFNFYLLKTDRGIFVFNVVENTIEYVDLFDDFVYYNDGYVGIINSLDERRQKNLGIYPQTENVIFYYNPNTKEKKILYTTTFNLTKIYHDLNQIYFEENDSKIYKLDNY